MISHQTVVSKIDGIKSVLVEEDARKEGGVFLQVNGEGNAFALGYLPRAEAVRVRDALTEVIDSIPTTETVTVRRPIGAALPDGWEMA